MAKRNKFKDNIFVDTSAWIMLLNNDEDRHAEARETYYCFLKAVPLVTSNLVISETYTWLRLRVGFKAAMNFFSVIHELQNNKLLQIVWSTRELEEKAFTLLPKYDDHHISFADAVSFAIMKELSITRSFTFDKHFMVVGFQPLNPL
ncbi:MAG: type II toxin-antitoxin system VapC family toxin [Thermincolia bacterium]